MAQRVVYADVEDIEERLIDIDTGLDLHLPGSAFSECETLGDICDVIWKHARPNAKGGQCPTSVSYYKIKRLIQCQVPGRIIGPDTCVADLEGFAYADLQDALRRDGWRPPSRRVSGLTWLLALTIATAGVLLPGLSNELAVAVWLTVFSASAWLAHRSLFRSGPPICKTVGELTRSASDLNTQRLRARGATGLNRTMVWRMLTHGIETEGGPAAPSARLRNL